MNYLILLLTTAIASASSIDLYDLDISIDGYEDPIYLERWFMICVAVVLIMALVLLSIGKRKKKQSAQGVVKEEKGFDVYGSENKKEKTTNTDSEANREPDQQHPKEQ